MERRERIFQNRTITVWFCFFIFETEKWNENKGRYIFFLLKLDFNKILRSSRVASTYFLKFHFFFQKNWMIIMMIYFNLIYIFDLISTIKEGMHGYGFIRRYNKVSIPLYIFKSSFVDLINPWWLSILIYIFFWDYNYNHIM